MLIQALHDIQERYGYLPEEELEFLALRAGVPLYRVQEASSFFPHFRREPPPAVAVQVCRSMTCHLRGSDQILDKARSAFADAIANKTMSIDGVSCLGRRDTAPVVCINRHGHAAGKPLHDHYHGNLGQAAAQDLLAAVVKGKDPPPPGRGSSDGVAAGPLWQINPYDSRHNTGHAPYAAVRQFLVTNDPNTTINALKTAGLVGMGGAAARTWKKWQDVRDAQGTTKYVVCNGDESEPGTFKDRELLLRTPHLVIEGMLLAGLTVNAGHGYIYIRHEYPEQIAAVRRALDEAQKLVPEAWRRCSLEVFVSPGLYICGEESALLQVIEGYRAQPRNTPPEIRTNGLFDKPTLVNNVETLAWVPAIMLKEQGEWYKQAGLRFFSISGDVRRPGVYEVPVNRTLRQLIDDQAGGIVEGVEFKAVASSGPSGGFLPRLLKADDLRRALAKNLPGLRKRDPTVAERVERFQGKALREGDEFLDVRDLELDVALFRAVELALGAGIVIYGEKSGQKNGMLEHALNCLQFFHKESCGKCVPCRLGCTQLVQLASDLRDKSAQPGQVESTVRTLAQVMEVTSICGLGRVAANPFTTFLDYFGDELD